MSWEEVNRNEQRQRRDQERQQREKALRDQQQRQHEDYMKQQNRHFDRLRKDDLEKAQRNPQPRGGASFVVWLFGGIGALFGGLNPPLNWDWFFGGTLGFLVGGFLGGYLSQRSWGRVLLWTVGLGFFGLIGFGIYRA